ncbi:hypothetical protein N780_00580 [Pontibacillus chungwhensis BH030062]|uniref:Uncharacterized protein n=1 Tax=Pontibacillus chungwhensis BH030062 TaxID=1385513 RepID=A0A0A2VFI3_9BACI|nr:hypothetical protein N780_00580 [Pontibacillus chungwhensis BH030062]
MLYWSVRWALKPLAFRGGRSLGTTPDGASAKEEASKLPAGKRVVQKPAPTAHDTGLSPFMSLNLTNLKQIF